MVSDLKNAPNVPLFGVEGSGDPAEDTLDGTAANLAGAVWLCGEIERTVKAAKAPEDPAEAAARLRQLAHLLAANARPLLAPGEADRAFRSLVQTSISMAQTTADEIDSSDDPDPVESE
jgi:hypothetical protein